MERYYINVPNGVRYISEFKDLPNLLPKGTFIMNKIVTGCGFTEYYLRNNQCLILCSPRLSLLDSKSSQHPIPECYRYRDGLDIKEMLLDMDFSSEQRADSNLEYDPDSVLEANRNVIEYIRYSLLQLRAPKILVTYDSLKHVIEILRLEGLLDMFQIVVDEFQCIFMDSRFKAGTEIEFITHLQSCPNVTYLSATPVLDEYLEQLDEFKNLPYYELIWPGEMIIKPIIYKKNVKSVNKAVLDVIRDYKNGIFPQKMINGNIIESKEAVFFINSVTDISFILKKSGLRPDEVNILCAKDSRNRAKLRKIIPGGSSVEKFDFGRIPLRGEPHKMFTFCTRTTYVGADFYSTNAYTYIVSNCKMENLSLDISLDLPQIMGRQRLKENVFRDEAVLFLTNPKIFQDEEEFHSMIQAKIEKSKSLIDIYSKVDNLKQKADLCDKFKSAIWLEKYGKDYISVVDNKLTNEPVAVFNNLVYISDLRAWRLHNKNFRDEISVLRSLEECGFSVENYISVSDDLINEFYLNFSKNNDFREKMKIYCDFLSNFPEKFQIVERLTQIPIKYHEYYALFGPEKLRALDYRELNIKNSLLELNGKGDLRLLVVQEFLVGNTYTKKYIKITLQKIYDNLGIKKTAKASDLEEYFQIKDASIRQDGKLLAAYKVLGIKEIIS